jgi:hypothetical protein
MELVPILSTIILVGTVATFILAVAAYILYKIREGRAQQEPRMAPVTAQEPHVLVTPQQPVGVLTGQPAPAQIFAPTTVVPPPVVVETAALSPRPALAQPEPNALFWELTDKGFVPVRQQGSGTPEATRPATEGEGYAWL